MLAGLIGVIFIGVVRMKLGHGLVGKHFLAQTVAFSAKDSSQEPARTASTPNAAPPRLALQNESEIDAEARRSREELEQLTEVAKLTPEQRLRAGGIIKDIQHARSMIEKFPDAKERRSLHEKLGMQERKAMDAVINPEQAAAVDAYFAKRRQQ